MSYLDEYDIKEPYETPEKNYMLWKVIRFLIGMTVIVLWIDFLTDLI